MSIQIKKEAIENIDVSNLICQNKTDSSIYSNPTSNPINSTPIRAGLLVPYNGQLYVSHIGDSGLQWFKLGNSTGDSSTTYNRIYYYADGSKFNGTLESENIWFESLDIVNGNLSLTLNENDYYQHENDYWLFYDNSRVSNFLAGYIFNPLYEPKLPDPENPYTNPYISGRNIIVNPPVEADIDFDINIVDENDSFVDGNVKVYACNWDWGDNDVPYIYRGGYLTNAPSYMNVSGTLSADTIRYLCIDYTPNRYEENADGDQFFYHYVRIVQLPSDLEMSDTFTITLNIDDPNDWHSEFYDWIKPDWSGSDECPWDDSVISGIA